MDNALARVIFCNIIGQIFYSIETLRLNTICIHENTGNIHIRGIFFVAFIGDHNKCLWIYKITRFSLCFGNKWEVMVLEVGGCCKVLYIRSMGGGGGYYQKLNKCKQGGRGSRLLSFCENVTIKCPLYKTNLEYGFEKTARSVHEFPFFISFLNFARKGFFIALW